MEFHYRIDAPEGIGYSRSWSHIFEDWYHRATPIRMTAEETLVVGDRGQRKHSEVKHKAGQREKERTVIQCWCGDWRPLGQVHYSGNDPESGPRHSAHVGYNCGNEGCQHETQTDADRCGMDDDPMPHCGDPTCPCN